VVSATGAVGGVVATLVCNAGIASASMAAAASQFLNRRMPSRRQVVSNKGSPTSVAVSGHSRWGTRAPNAGSSGAAATAIASNQGSAVRRRSGRSRKSSRPAAASTHIANSVHHHAAACTAVAVALAGAIASKASIAPSSVGTLPAAAMAHQVLASTCFWRRSRPSRANASSAGPGTRSIAARSRPMACGRCVVSTSATVGDLGAPSQSASGSSHSRLPATNAATASVRRSAPHDGVPDCWSPHSIVRTSDSTASPPANAPTTVAPAANGSARQMPAHGNQAPRWSGRSQRHAASSASGASAAASCSRGAAPIASSHGDRP